VKKKDVAGQQQTTQDWWTGPDVEDGSAAHAGRTAWLLTGMETGRVHWRGQKTPTLLHEKKRTMDKVRVFYDRAGNTLSVWFDDPKKEHVCEESDDDLILVKDRRGRVIGFERLNYLTAKQRKEGVNIPVEVEMG
jgi:hypothetical protein